MSIRTVATRIDWPRTSVERSLGWASFFGFWAVAAAAAATGKDGLVNGLHVPWLWLVAPIATAHLAAVLPLIRARRQVEISVDDDGVRIHGRLGDRTLPSAQITSGYAMRAGGKKSVLSLSLRDGSIVRITFAAGGDADDALALLRLTAAERRATIPLASPELRYARALLWAVGHGVAMFLLLHFLDRVHIDPFSGLGWAVFSMITGFLLLRGSRLPEIEIGVDAITVRSAFERKTIDVGDILAVHRFGMGTPGDADCVDLTLKGGAELNVRAHQRDPYPSPSLGEAIKRRIEGARAARDARAGSPEIKQLARSGRPFEAWRNDVAALAAPASAYRAASILFADLARVVADPIATPEQRIGAALALGKNAGRAQREAVRVAARTCIGPKLRVALTETLREHPDEATILAALVEVEAKVEAEIEAEIEAEAEAAEDAVPGRANMS
jgi:hypothetical protein